MRFKLQLGFVFLLLQVLVSTNIVATQWVRRSGSELETNVILTTEEVRNELERESESESELLTSTTLAASLSDTFGDIEQLIRSLVQNLASNVPRIVHDTEELLTKLSRRIAGALEAFRNKMSDAGDELVRDIFTSMHQQLVQVRNEFQGLAQKVDVQFDWAVTHLNESLMNHTESFDTWAANLKQELRTVNNTSLYKEGCQAVDAFIQRSTAQLQNCCNITIKPVRSLCRSARAVLAEAFRVLADTMDRMQSCLEDKNSYLEYMIPCINVAYDDVSALISQAVELRHKVGTMLPVKILYSKCCISIMLVQMEQRQRQMEKDLQSMERKTFK